ncbi:Retrovirus-related Pol polyprotein from transposon TNT 1-94 [Senna tora]|uniref:Retrovirus-related Pol polyprotein from transposon TNT 1-94 n=1 Tax=Senna tora TaxID=362788 RepID=A0A834TH26_9FABA|nr:Retrovirus-related Pol polyprotein from transposon TNT 1-94 [Senna tora]
MQKTALKHPKKCKKNEITEKLAGGAWALAARAVATGDETMGFGRQWLELEKFSVTTIGYLSQEIDMKACLSPFFIMASSKSSSQEASSSNANEFSGIAENSVLLLTRHKLTGQNYRHWSRSMIMFITGKGKEDYLTNSTKPQPDDPKFKTWNAENQMVMSWLINSMDLEIGQDFMFFATAAEIWKAAKESYSDVENTAELFEIKGALHDLKQGELSVPQYFNTLNQYWLQLDMFECPEWKCSEDAATYQKLVEKERIYKFLLGLNKSLDNIRGRILSVKPLPSLREVLSTVRHEESRRKLMLGSLADSDSVNGSALAVHNPGNGQKKGRPWCDHCHRTGHVKDKCWKLHGKPSDWKSLKDKNAASGLHSSAVSDPKESSSSAVFSKEQMDVLQKLLNQGSSHVVATGCNAENGNFPTSFHVTSNPSRYWIVDSGASDHMTGDSGMFSSWYPYTQNYKVRIADGSLADVTGIGEVSLSDSITLKSVLFVPKLKCNLLSVAKLAHDSNCKAEFSHSSCSFQDVDSRKMIGNARVRDDLYRFEMNKEIAPNKQSFAARKIEDSLKEDREIMLLHFRLGHPNFVYLSKLYPSLFLKKNPNDFVCHHCIPAKHSRTSYPKSSYKPFAPFALIHSDIWGPSKIKNISGARWFITFTDDHTRISWVFLLKEKSAAAKGVDETRVEDEDPMHCQDTPSDPHSHEKGNTAPNFAISNVCPDEILSPPIAKRKGVRSCTLHPISQFVSYEKLSPKFQAFVSNLDKEFYSCPINWIPALPFMATMPGYKSKSTSIWLDEGPMTVDFILEPEVAVKGTVLNNVFDCNCITKSGLGFVEILWGAHLEVFFVLILILGFLCLFQRKIRVNLGGPKRRPVI